MHVRSLLTVALAALLAAPAAASAQTRRGPTTTAASAGAGPSALSIGGWLGYETGDLDGVQLRVEGEMPFQRLTPQIDLSFVGALGYSRLSEDLGGGLDVVANVLKIVPAARFTLPVNPQLSVFGDAGLGLYYASVSMDVLEFNPVTFQFERGEISDSSVGLMLRLGVGGLFAVNPATKLGVQLALDPMFGDYDDATFTILAGLTYQM